jgi:ribonuclease HI
MDAWFDGGSRGNPGIAGSGWVLKSNEGTIVVQAGCVFIGTHHTNNEAEYSGLIAALEAARAHNVTQLTIYGDSLLVINQMNNLWQVRDANMRRLYTKAASIARDIPQVTYIHVLRHLNKEADYLSNIAMDSMQTQMGVHLLNLKTTPCKPIYSGPTVSVRIRREKGKIVQDCDVWVGGAWTKGGWQLMRSDWCNPYHHTDKEQGLQAYIQYILKNPTLLARINTDLKGKRLGCFCEPTDAFCHAAWLARMADS